MRADWNINKWIGFVHFPVSTSEFRKFFTLLNFTVFYKSFSLVWLCCHRVSQLNSAQAFPEQKLEFFLLMDGFWILVKGFASCGFDNEAQRNHQELRFVFWLSPAPHYMSVVVLCIWINYLNQNGFYESNMKLLEPFASKSVIINNGCGRDLRMLSGNFLNRLPSRIFQS